MSEPEAGDLDVDSGVEAEHAILRDADDSQSIAEHIKLMDKEWVDTERPLSLEAVSWRPHLSGRSKNWILHVHLSSGTPQYLARRIRATHEAGYQVHIACYIEALYDVELLRVLAVSDAYVYVLDDPRTPNQRRHFLAAMADLGVPVSPKVRRDVMANTWSRLSEGTAYEKGRRLEALLAFLLAQVGDFRVFSRNFRNESQEIDIVLQVDSYGTRCWHRNAPFILVESKNTQDVIGQPAISLMFRKLETKRGSAKIALFFSVGGFTADAGIEELRSSTTEYCVAMFGREDIEAAINAEDIDGYFDDRVGRALLR